jgi:hypothetical protein
MRAPLTLELPTQPNEGCQYATGLGSRPGGHRRRDPSRRAEGHAAQIWASFSMFEAVGEHAKRERFHSRQSLVAGGTVREHTGKITHFGRPATILFALDLDGEEHV